MAKAVKKKKQLTRDEERLEKSIAHERSLHHDPDFCYPEPTSVDLSPDPDTVSEVPYDPKVKWLKCPKGLVPVTPLKIEHFLKVLSLCGLPKRAAIASAIPYSAITKLRKNDVMFDLSCDEAVHDAVDMAEFELYRRAVEGDDVELTNNGIPTGYSVKKRSDKLLMFLLQAKRSEYKTKMELNANLTTRRGTDQLSDEELETIIRTRFSKGEEP